MIKYYLIIILKVYFLKLLNHAIILYMLKKGFHEKLNYKNYLKDININLYFINPFMVYYHHYHKTIQVNNIQHILDIHFQKLF